MNNHKDGIIKTTNFLQFISRVIYNNINEIVR